MEKSYGNFEIILKVGREEIAIKYGCRFRQGDNLAPTMFVIVMQLVTEDVLHKLEKIITHCQKLCMTKMERGVTIGQGEWVKRDDRARHEHAHTCEW